MYIIKVSKWFMLYMPIIVKFYAENGLDLKELFVLQAVYSIAIVALEIPSGYLADVLGRKVTLVIGTIFGTLGFLTYSLTTGFWGFFAAEITLGIGTSLISGADSAMLFDTLLTSNKKQNYMKHEGRITSAGNFAEAVAGVLGGFLATITIRTPYFAQTAVAFIGIPAALMLIEPTRHKSMTILKFSDILNVIKYALVDNKLLRRNILFSSVIGTSTLTMAWFVQPYFMLVDVPLSLYGILWTALNLTVAMVSMYAWRIERWLGEAKSVILIGIMISAGYLSVGLVKAYWGISFFFIFYIIRGIATPVLKDYINKLTSSDIRATVLSVRSFVIRILFAMGGPFLGWYSDKFSIQQALLLAGGIFLLLNSIFISLYLSLRMKRK
ncbi:MAG: MFS transporter [Bacteroidales bacterium]